MDLCWLVMAILSLGSRRSRPLRIFLVYRPSTRPVPEIITNAHDSRAVLREANAPPIPRTELLGPNGMGESITSPQNMGARRATFKPRGATRTRDQLARSARSA